MDLQKNTLKKKQERRNERKGSFPKKGVLIVVLFFMLCVGMKNDFLAQELNPILMSTKPERFEDIIAFSTVGVSCKSVNAYTAEMSKTEELKAEPENLNLMIMLEEDTEKILDIVEEQKRREEERLKKEIELQRSRERARAEERQEARRQAIEIEKKREAEEKAKEKAEKEKFMYLLPEVDFLGKIIEVEAAKSWEDRRRVGSVVLNRVRTTYIDFRYIYTIKQAFYQGTQYSNYSKNEIAKGIEATPEAMKVAYGLITGEIPCLEEEILFQSKNEKAWMPGRLKRANLSNQEQYYGIPLDFNRKCL